MLNCEVLVKFDDRTAGTDEMRAFFNTMDKYNAIGIGHDKRNNSSLFIKTERPLNRKILQKELGENKIIRISKM